MSGTRFPRPFPILLMEILLQVLLFPAVGLQAPPLANMVTALELLARRSAIRLTSMFRPRRGSDIDADELVGRRQERNLAEPRSIPPRLPTSRRQGEILDDFVSGARLAASDRR